MIEEKGHLPIRDLCNKASLDLLGPGNFLGTMISGRDDAEALFFLFDHHGCNAIHSRGSRISDFSTEVKRFELEIFLLDFRNENLSKCLRQKASSGAILPKKQAGH